MNEAAAISGGTAPAIVLVAPQMGENIGAAARAMLNCGLEDLRLVNPRDGWPSAAAEAMAAGALEKMPPVRVYESVGAALAGVHFVLATTARLREMVKPVFTPREAAVELRKHHGSCRNTAILFGGERAGLTNDDVTLAHGIITIPLNSEFSSLNLGQAVLLVAYEWAQATVSPSPFIRMEEGENAPAAHEKFLELCERLEGELEAHNFFRNPDQKPSMVRNLRNMLSRAGMTEQEVRTFHGIVTALTGGKGRS